MRTTRLLADSKQQLLAAASRGFPIERPLSHSGSTKTGCRGRRGTSTEHVLGGMSREVAEQPATGGGEELLLRVGQEESFASDSSLDGRFLLYQRRNAATGWDLWTLPLHEAGASVPVVQTESDERNGQFSPDGKWIAYESNSSGPSEVFMQPFAAAGKRVQVSTREVPRFVGGQMARNSSTLRSTER